eukprot:gene9381-biopygen3210
MPSSARRCHFHRAEDHQGQKKMWGMSSAHTPGRKNWGNDQRSQPGQEKMWGMTSARSSGRNTGQNSKTPAPAVPNTCFPRGVSNVPTLSGAAGSNLKIRRRRRRRQHALPPLSSAAARRCSPPPPAAAHRRAPPRRGAEQFQDK